MSWARIMAPLAGSDADTGVLAAAATVAAWFGGEVAGVHIPLDTAAISPWFSEGVGADVAALAAVREADVEGRKRALAAMESLAAPSKTFLSLEPPHLLALSIEARLSDVVVFDGPTACGKGRLGDTFRTLIFGEQRPVIVAKGGLSADTVCLAWDGGKEASRAARTAIPLMRKAGRVIILTAPEASSRDADPNRLRDFLANHRVQAETETVSGSDAGAVLLDAARAHGAGLLISGAFGHARLKEIVFGGVTRALLNAEGPSLYLSH